MDGCLKIKNKNNNNDKKIITSKECDCSLPLYFRVFDYLTVIYYFLYPNIKYQMEK